MDNMIRYVTYSNKLNYRILNWTLTQKMESNPEILGLGRDHDIFSNFGPAQAEWSIDKAVCRSLVQTSLYLLGMLIGLGWAEPASYW